MLAEGENRWWVVPRTSRGPADIEDEGLFRDTLHFHMVNWSGLGHKGQVVRESMSCFLGANIFHFIQAALEQSTTDSLT